MIDIGMVGKALGLLWYETPVLVTNKKHKGAEHPNFMYSAPLPSDDPVRLQALSANSIFDTPSKLQFDDLTFPASHICQTPIAIISFIDPARQWFKSTVGFSASETSQDIGFCPHAILAQQILVVRDFATELRFADNPLVTKDRQIRFYTGAPLVPNADYT